MTKNLDETVGLQSEKREGWIRKIGGVRLQGIAEGTSSATRQASSSVASFLVRNGCLSTYCSLTEEEEREDSSCQICQRD